MNSKSIKTFARWIYLCKKKLQIYIDSSLEWHMSSLGSLSNLKSPGLVTVVNA
jgi:hypothetical protein